ncbi:methyltransferase [Bifidobacterium ramosum]|uniref:Methyltransferase n=1 Tax=Bifidobacterium ramosum TaxID=1798158 RepID=A0A6L4X297_9BIFI|nr:methyltransferase [Bifidobacterium ramosum]KAB8289249.1 methyltransferase [Bifidobacterium ramosum]NEG70955.1 methyltransferase [Bifidobacterium ramosum]
MDKTSYTNLAKAWEYAEDHAFSRQASFLNVMRRQAEEAGFPQGSAAQAELLATLVQLTGATSVIAVGTGSLVETLQLVSGLRNAGQLTAVDSSAQGIGLIRGAFAKLSDYTATKLRAVNAPAGTFLPRLNGDDYDLIVVAGDADNYAATFDQAPRLLRGHGAVVFTDVLALETAGANGGVLNPADRGDKAVAMREFIDVVESDERFDSTLTPSGTGLLVAVKR